MSQRHCEHAERREALGLLKSDQRIALVLFAAGYSYAEVGARKQWTYSKVNRSIAEGQAALSGTQ